MSNSTDASTVDNNETDKNPVQPSDWTSPSNHGNSPFTSSLATAVVYWIIFIVGISGNVFLLYVNVLRRGKKKHQSATQLFMISLAASDLGLLLGSTWSNATLALQPNFTYGQVVCKIRSFWSSLSADGSILILTIIAVDRQVYTTTTIENHCWGPSLWPRGIGARLRRNRLRVRILTVSDTHHKPCSYIEPIYYYSGPFGVLWAHQGSNRRRVRVQSLPQFF